LTSPRTAADNTYLLENSIKQEIYIGHYTNFDKQIGNVFVAYNQTANFGVDSLETLLQKFGWEWLTNLFIPSHQTDLSAQVTKYENSIKSGHRVLVVAHSQVE